jgi:hypothetical protein
MSLYPPAPAESDDESMEEAQYCRQNLEAFRINSRGIGNESGPCFQSNREILLPLWSTNRDGLMRRRERELWV